MAKYNEEFKSNAVALLREVKVGTTKTHDGQPIKNVRELCAYLGVGSQALYQWDKKIKEAEKNDTIEIESDFKYDNTHLVKEIPADIIKLGIGFYRDYARGLGIKNYSNLRLPTLKLKIGLILIKQSKLIKGKAREILNGVKI